MVNSLGAIRNVIQQLGYIRPTPIQSQAWPILLNGNDFDQLYKLIGCIICIFGSPDNDDAEEYLEQVINVSEVSLYMVF